MGQYLEDMINEGWQIENASKEPSIYDSPWIVVTFSHLDKDKVPTSDWLYDKEESYYSNHRIYIKAKTTMNFLSEDDKLKLSWYDENGPIINPSRGKFGHCFQNVRFPEVHKINQEEAPTTIEAEKTEVPTLETDANNKTPMQKHQDREKFNKRLAEANIKNQIKRDIATNAGNLGYYVPVIPTIVK